MTRSVLFAKHIVKPRPELLTRCVVHVYFQRTRPKYSEYDGVFFRRAHVNRNLFWMTALNGSSDNKNAPSPWCVEEVTTSLYCALAHSVSPVEKSSLARL